MTDPSYRGQILVFTTPLIGNYGVPINKTPIDSKDVGVILESEQMVRYHTIVSWRYIELLYPKESRGMVGMQNTLR